MELQYIPVKFPLEANPLRAAVSNTDTLSHTDRCVAATELKVATGKDYDPRLHIDRETYVMEGIVLHEGKRLVVKDGVVLREYAEGDHMKVTDLNETLRTQSKEEPSKLSKWDEYFLDVALDSTKLSKDPSSRVGAVIVGPDQEIRSTGCNGFPRGVLDTEERLNNKELKYQLIVHAEINAILNAVRIGVSVKGCSLYLVARKVNSNVIWGGPPCIRCTVELINAGIKEIVSHREVNVPQRWKDSVAFSREILREAGVIYREV